MADRRRMERTVDFIVVPVVNALIVLRFVTRLPSIGDWLRVQSGQAGTLGSPASAVRV